jgi:hypothetical protein
MSAKALVSGSLSIALIGGCMSYIYFADTIATKITINPWKRLLIFSAAMILPFMHNGIEVGITRKTDETKK